MSKIISATSRNQGISTNGIVDSLDDLVSEPEIKIKKDLMNLFWSLAESDSKEWILYVTGERNEGTIEIGDKIYLPPQKRTRAAVDDIDFPSIGEEIDVFKLENGTLREETLELEERFNEEFILVVHSHNSMNTFMSSDDNETINSNYEASIVVNNSNEYAARAKGKIEGSNRVALVEPDMTVLGQVSSEALEEDLEEKTKTVTYSTGINRVNTKNTKQQRVYNYNNYDYGHRANQGSLETRTLDETIEKVKNN